MTSITNQLSGLLSLKWVRKYFQKDRTTSLHREGSSQKCDCQCSRYKVLGSGSSNGSASGTIDDQTEPVRPHEEAYQYHQPSAMIWENPKPGLEETNESINPCLKKQHPAFLFPAKLDLLGPPLPPPPNKPLPEIPTQARPHKMPDKIGRNRQDTRPPTWNLANTTQRTTANYSAFPKLAMVPPPRGSSLHHSSRPHRKTHKSQRISCANTTVTKQLHRHVAEPYQDTSMERENAVKELGDVPIEKPLPRDTRSPSLEKRVIGTFAFCSSPTWVDISETLYNIASKIPILSSATHTFVMKTFFNQFPGGETTENCIPKIQYLRNRQIGTLPGYNIEAELDGSSKDPELIPMQTQLVLESIDAQGQLAKQYCPDASAYSGDNRCWVRIKITSLLPHPVALYHGSNVILRTRGERGLDLDVPCPGLPHDGDWEAALNGREVTELDRQQLLSLRATMEAIASKARDNNVRIVIDAEQSWYQPVIDSLTDELLQKYNTLDGPATCIAWFQAYLRRFPQLLDQQVARAEERGYKLLFNQIRGSYMVTEAERWKTDGKQGHGPVRETGHSKLSAVFATHNSISVGLGLDLLQKHGLARRNYENGKLVVSKGIAGSFAFAQLYGKLPFLRSRDDNASD
ncbi:hypothetical protein H9L39_06066 [Fusarium oxysporum f. sp. albedinis]|nr:hypothetical protein H9L39_06066 [Fusarium oxysporum f. sp. albedinis]